MYDFKKSESSEGNEIIFYVLNNFFIKNIKNILQHIIYYLLIIIHYVFKYSIEGFPRNWDDFGSVDFRIENNNFENW